MKYIEIDKLKGKQDALRKLEKLKTMLPIFDMEGPFQMEGCIMTKESAQNLLNGMEIILKATTAEEEVRAGQTIRDLLQRIRKEKTKMNNPRNVK